MRNNRKYVPRLFSRSTMNSASVRYSLNSWCPSIAHATSPHWDILRLNRKRLLSRSTSVTMATTAWPTLKWVDVSGSLKSHMNCVDRTGSVHITSETLNLRTFKDCLVHFQEHSRELIFRNTNLHSKYGQLLKNNTSQIDLKIYRLTFSPLYRPVPPALGSPFLRLKPPS